MFVDTLIEIGKAVFGELQKPHNVAARWRRWAARIEGRADRMRDGKRRKRLMDRAHSLRTAADRL